MFRCVQIIRRIIFRHCVEIKEMHIDSGQSILVQMIFFALNFFPEIVNPQYHYEEAHQNAEDFENLNFNSTNSHRSFDDTEWVVLYDVPVLKFEAGEYSTGWYPGPQLQCIGGTAGPDVEQPTVVICFNYGLNEAKNNLKTDCRLVSRLPDTKLGKHAIICEYYSDDQESWLIADGSCILEYELDWDADYAKNCALCAKNVEACILTANQLGKFSSEYGLVFVTFFLVTWTYLIFITFLYFKNLFNRIRN